MTDTTSAPTPPTLLEPSDYDRFMLRTATEILPVLRGLHDHRAQVTIFFNEGNDLLLTMLVAVENDHLILDIGADPDVNGRALEAPKHFCVASLDKVRIQFLLREFRQVDYEGRPALRCPLPAEVLRLQRREFYRLNTPVARPLKCLMPLPLPDGSVHIHEANVFDISGGGMGVSSPPEGVPFGQHKVFPNCRVELPEVGMVTCTLKVCSIFDVPLKSGLVSRRAGCEFVKLPGTMMTLIQRYILKVERERKARESGLSF